MIQDTSNTLSKIRSTFYCGIVEKEQMKWHLVGRTLVRPTNSHRTDILCGSVGGCSDA